VATFGHFFRLVYVTYDWLECHRPPNYKVCAGDTMRSGFIVNKSSNEFYGALIYRLQRRQPHESIEVSEDTSSAVHLLVVWDNFALKSLRVNVLLLEYDKGFDKLGLETLRRGNIKRLKLRPDSAVEIWSLDDNTALLTAFKIMNKGQLLNIVISEIERDNGARIPARVDPER
jgi:hypothetical protein